MKLSARVVLRDSRGWCLVPLGAAILLFSLTSFTLSLFIMHEHETGIQASRNPYSSGSQGGKCLVSPGQHDFGEGNQIGFHNLLLARETLEGSRRLLPKQDVRLFCVFPQFEHATLLDAARKTYGLECDGHIYISSETMPPDNPVKYAYQIPDFPRESVIPAFFELLERIQAQFDWLHIVKQDHYSLIPHIRKRISFLDENENKPLTLRSYSFRISEVQNKTEARGTCEEVSVLNRPALQSMFKTLMNNGQKHTSDSLSDFINIASHSSSIKCAKGLPLKTKNPHKWTSMSLVPTRMRSASSFDRIKLILEGDCDEAWESRITAFDVSGRPGYKHDVRYLRKHPPPFTFHPEQHSNTVCSDRLGAGAEGRHGALALDKIQLSKVHQDIKVLCMVYTEESRHDRLRAVAETWGKDCDGFFAASTKTEKSIGAVKLSHEGNEEYDNMWLKVRAMWKYAYDNYRDDFDFFTIGGDDHFFIPENFRYAVREGNWAGPYNMSVPLLLGGSLADPSNRSTMRYCGGGSGYALNRKALETFVGDLFPRAECWPHWRSSEEDRIISGCFRSIGIQCYDTNDAINETRYHPWNAEYHAKWTHDTLSNSYPRALEKAHGIAQLEKLGQISKSSVSFHLKPLKPDPTLPPDSGMRRYYALLHDLC